MVENQTGGRKMKAVILLFYMACAAMAAETNETGFGSVTGVATYNVNWEARPDVGSRVYLVAWLEIDKLVSGRHINKMGMISDDSVVLFSDNTITVVPHGSKEGTDTNAFEMAVARSSSVDGGGKFTLAKVQSGHYLVICRSKHTERDSLRDIGGKVIFNYVDVVAGESVDVSLDCGTDGKTY
jgi:hypothetical protein